MSIALICLGWILLLITPLAIELLVRIRVHGGGWPISVSICCKYTALRALRDSAPNFASAADDMTAFMIIAMVRIAPILGGYLLLFDRKKCPLAWLCEFFSLQYPALLCTARIILLALYAITGSSCIAQ